MYRPSLNDLDAVLAIARKGSFRAAALDLGMSTTGLSNAVGKLEASLGVRLFNRTTRSVSPTDAGRLFVERAGPALQDIHGAMEAVRSQQATPSGTLRINAFATAAREILGSDVVQIDHMGAYACRNVNNGVGSNRISAHSQAAALDFAGVRLRDGRRITVTKDWNGDTPEARFLKRIRDDACRIFGTTLSPDYNAVHYDHLHLEATDTRFCR